VAKIDNWKRDRKWYEQKKVQGGDKSRQVKQADARYLGGRGGKPRKDETKTRGLGRGSGRGQKTSQREEPYKSDAGRKGLGGPRSGGGKNKIRRITLAGTAVWVKGTPLRGGKGTSQEEKTLRRNTFSNTQTEKKGKRGTLKPKTV